MYDKNFWERANISQLCKFIRYGAIDLKPEEAGSFEERYKKYNQNFNEGIYKFRDLILKTNWDLIKSEVERNMKTEYMYDDLLHAQGDLSDLAFEVGVTIGIELGQELKKNKKAVSY